MTPSEKKTIHDLAVKDISNSFLEIKKKIGNEEMYGFGLGMVEDITGFFCAANTLESLKEILQKESDNEDVSSYWLISEWKYEAEPNNDLYEFLSTFIYDIKDAKYNEVRTDYENILIKALKTCDKKGVFGHGADREKLIIYIHYVDAFNEEMDSFSSQQINSPFFHNLFENRWEKNPENNLTFIIKSKLSNIK